MTLPNFFIIGAAKSGTSSLYMYLKQHPDIFMSPVKEPHYFSFDDNSKMTQGPGDPIPKAITNFQAYQQLFEGANNEKAIGEASTSYLYRPQAAGRIHQLIPNAKLIAILRNPADRAFSAYMHVVRDQRETAINFKQALQLEKSRQKNNWEPIWHYTNVGFYCEQLSHYFQRFDKDQIKILIYEDFINDQQSVLREVFNFLEVDPGFMPDLTVRFNVSGKQKSKILHAINKMLFNSPNPLRWFSRQVIPDSWRWKVTSWFRERNLKKQPIPTMVKQELMDLYRDDIKNLQALIDKDLSGWFN